MPRTPRRRVREGIFRDKYSLTGVVQVGTGKNKIYEEKPFDWDESYDVIERWRERRRNELRDIQPTVASGSIAAELPRYLERCAKYPASLGSRESEMKAWIAVRIKASTARTIGGLRRHTVKPAHCDAAIAAWQKEGKSAKTILNRCRTFHHFFVTMADDKKARTPLDNIDIPTPEKKDPVGVSVKTLVAVEIKLRAAGDPKTHARFMVQAAEGIRPSQMKRMTRDHLKLDQGMVLVPAGKGGKSAVHILTDDMLAAWTLFDRADAYGEYDSTEFARAVRAAGWPKDVRIYNTKHSFGMELAEQQVDNEDVQAWLGHTDPKTTKIYTGVPMQRMRRVAEKMSGRLGWADLAKPENAPSFAPSLHGDKRPKEAKTGQKSRARRSA
jgi:site-specific recombinase XerD